MKFWVTHGWPSERKTRAMSVPAVSDAMTKPRRVTVAMRDTTQLKARSLVLPTVIDSHFHLRIVFMTSSSVKTAIGASTMPSGTCTILGDQRDVGGATGLKGGRFVVVATATA